MEVTSSGRSEREKNGGREALARGNPDCTWCSFHLAGPPSDTDQIEARNRVDFDEFLLQFFPRSALETKEMQRETEENRCLRCSGKMERESCRHGQKDGFAWCPPLSWSLIASPFNLRNNDVVDFLSLPAECQRSERIAFDRNKAMRNAVERLSQREVDEKRRMMAVLGGGSSNITTPFASHRLAVVQNTFRLRLRLIFGVYPLTLAGMVLVHHPLLVPVTTSSSRSKRRRRERSAQIKWFPDSNRAKQLKQHILTDDSFPKRPAQTEMGVGFLLSQTELIEEAVAEVVTVKVELLARTWRASIPHWRSVAEKGTVKNVFVGSRFRCFECIVCGGVLQQLFVLFERR
ncbi:unnamed protein product [Darwinula stevensoni]|uniref:Uncharacterized protein n=1 Tax=Darwinula stevensoni TaxID=69355 RepID=A0A7R8X886_9CRUS|nr:unnamed protein product [Darwinula stevensoni]CAG0889432.1 unnamed protein product [Darwinula stevensoni]